MKSSTMSAIFIHPRVSSIRVYTMLLPESSTDHFLQAFKKRFPQWPLILCFINIWPTQRELWEFKTQVLEQQMPSSHDVSN